MCVLLSVRADPHAEPARDLQKTFEFTANAQMWPRSLNADIGGDSAATYLIIGDMGTPSGQGMDFISGFTFLCVYLHSRCVAPCSRHLANATTLSTIPLTPRSGSPQRPRRLLPPTEPGCGSTRSRTNLVSCIDSISRHAAMRPFVLDKIHIRYISGQEVRSYIIMIMMNSPYRFYADVWGPIKSLCIYDHIAK